MEKGQQALDVMEMVYKNNLRVRHKNNSERK